MSVLWATPLLLVLFVFSEGEELTAMDYIIKANIGKEKEMNVHKFDIRLPPFRSGAGDDELDAAARDQTRLWPGGVVPYVIDKSIRERSRYQANLEKAMKEWMTYTCIKFRERKTKDQDYVVFSYGVGCNADVGRKGYRQYVSLGKGCSDPSVIIHEIGHVVGFWHEQNRPDRNKYVDIIWNNIIEKYKFAFAEYTERRIDSRNISYDYKSIMHYGNNAFAKDRRKATIVAKKGGGATPFGNLHLSPLDIKQANIVYKCPAKESTFPKFPDDFVLTMNGPQVNKTCIMINEPRKRRPRRSWLCYKKVKQPVDIVWSHSGKKPNMDCTHISSPFGNDRLRLWDNNYLCVANDSVYKFHWVKGKPIKGLGCLQWPNSKGKNTQKAFLCAKSTGGPIDGSWSLWSTWTKCSKDCGGGYQERRRYCTNPEPKNYGKPCYGVDYKRQYCNLQQCTEYPVWPEDFMFSYFPHTPYDKNCVRIYERDAGPRWENFYFCSVGNKRNIRMRWSDMGPQRGMRCTKIYEPMDNKWDYNYLCVPHRSKYRFEWSNSGPIRGLECIQWLAKNGSNGWDNNYLCGRRVQMQVPTKNNNLKLHAHAVASEVVHGGWSKWTSWSRCSKTCGQGIQLRSRSCTDPTPSQAGRSCRGRGRDMRRCKITDCPKLTCGGTLKGLHGTFTTPLYPNKYPHNKECTWLITVPLDRLLKVKFVDFYLEFDGKCSYDRAEVLDGGTEVAPKRTFCGRKNPGVLTAFTNRLMIKFKSDATRNYRGFKASWFTVKRNFL